MRLSPPDGRMFWGYKSLISTLRSMIRSRILMEVLCLLLLVLSIGVIPERCHAFEAERTHENHFRIAPETIWNHSSMPLTPFENRCSCSSSTSPCCVDARHSTPKESQVPLVSGDTPRRLPVLQTTIMRPFESKPLSETSKSVRDLSSLDQEEFFLVNCTFLI